MTQPESQSSPVNPKISANEASFLGTTNAAVNNVIDIAEARATLAKANSSSQGLSAWALDLYRRIIGTEGSNNMQRYADLVNSAPSGL